jgi:Protein of unknown function (DUF1822)
MTLTIQQLQAIEPERIWLELTPEDLKLAQPNPKIHSNQTSLDNAELSQLCLNKFQDWLKEQEISSKVSFTPNELTTIWDVVSGCAIDIGKTRLVLIPTDYLDRDEFCIPQEWVDLPNWMGDYYLAVQVDSESGLMSIWGFASHQLIKDRGEYTLGDRSYSLDCDLLVTNLDILWMAQELGLNERAITPELPTLGLDETLALIKQLSTPSPYSPRTKLAFSQWGAILNNSNLRLTLYEERVMKDALVKAAPPIFQFVDWVKGEFTSAIASGWQAYIPEQGIPRSQNSLVQRSKLIHFQLDFNRETLRLLIGVIPENDEQMFLSVRVDTGGNSRYLPPQLEVSYIDEHGEVRLSKKPNLNDEFIEMKFTCDVGTEFNIQLKLADDRIIERFVA